MKTAAIYCRVSTEDQEREGTSLQTQLEACMKYCQDRSYDVGHCFSEAYSGLTLERPKLDELRELVRKGDISVIVVYCLDRLSRDPTHGVILTQEFEKYHVTLEAVTETVDSSELGKLISYIRGFASKLEAEKIRERTMRGKKARAKSGRLPGGRETQLYGYYYVRGKGIGEGVRYINEDEAKWVREIFVWLVEEGFSVNHIVKQLRALEAPTPSGEGFWGRSTVHNILRNVAYTGKTYVFTQTQVEGQRHYKETRKHRATHRLFKPTEEWLEVPNSTPAIISEELFNEAQARLQRNKELSPRNAKRQYLLRGHVFCQRCRRRYYGGTVPRRSNGTMERHRYYSCPRNVRITSPIPCGNRAWNADYLEEVVWQKIEELLAKPDVVLAELTGRENEDKESSLHLTELETVHAKLRHLAKEKERVWKAFELTGDEAQFSKEIKDVMEKIEALQKQRLELERRIEASKQAEVDMESIRRFCDIVKANLAGLSFEDKRLALEALDIKVWIDGDSIAVGGVVPVEDNAIASTLSW